ncbi:MAG: hypothetical protein HW390_2362 [Candidatus Brocadiaceae bacterium]|nr:hypothetical protein [Candidatus Brocadiaceae bacterium]
MTNQACLPAPVCPTILTISFCSGCFPFSLCCLSGQARDFRHVDVEMDFTFVRLKVSGQDVYEGGFAGAVFASQKDNLSLLEVYRDIVKYDLSAKGLF